jgi:hypothetical protein
MMKTKVFCVGFHKTGTTSLGIALKKLGYRVAAGANMGQHPDIANNVLPIAYDFVEKYDAFQDNPWPIIYKELDAKYPGSKFILILRDSKSWIKSLVKDFGRRETPMRKWIYGVGCPEGNEAIYIKRFEEHNREVLNYFKNRPQDLLVMNLAQGDGWDKLCTFLEVDVPSDPFPHANKASAREKKNGSNVFKKMKNYIGRMIKRFT